MWMNVGPTDGGDGALPEVSIVIPVYRSEECLEALVHAIDDALAAAGLRFEVILVNDDSPDGSWRVIERLCRTHGAVVGVDLRRNFGQDNAILVGLRLVRGRYVAIMDDDLQHHPRDLPRLFAGLDRGADVAYAAFAQRHHPPWKKLGSWFNGKVAEWLIGKPRGVYLSPYKALRREVAELLCRYEGPDPYVDGLLLQATSRITQVPVQHQPRFRGHSTYTLGKCLKVWGRLAFSGSVRPLRLAAGLGMVTAAAGVLAVFGGLGWRWLVAAQLVVSAVQLVLVSTLGEYAGRTYRAVSRHPLATVRATLRATEGARPGVRRTA
jgi:undecaprenyl-phosphate 4-deoxy-4-formamido-L-arabinose transferase